MSVASTRSVSGSSVRLRAFLAAVVVVGAVSAVTLAAPGTASASTAVTNCNDSGAGSLRAAVASGGTTSFALSPPCSTITLTSGPIILTTKVAITGPGAPLLAVSGGGTSQVFVVLAGVNATISGLTIESGNNASGVGGGIDNRGGTVAVTNSKLSGNTSAHDGGAICNGDSGDGNGTICDGSGTVTLTHSTVSGNSAKGEGGGIANGSGTLTVINSTISGNTTTHTFAGGGGIANAGGTVVVTNSSVSGNTSPGAFGAGGGVYNIGTATLTNTTVSGNLAGGSHGGADGGGIANFSGDSLTITNSTITGNTAKVGGSGGGIFNEGGTASVSFSTISGNKLGPNSGSFGAGADIENFTSASLTLTGSIVANGSPSGDNCGLVSPLTDGGYNLDSDGSCGLSLSTDVSGVDPQLGPLAANGGPTQTMALASTSPAVDTIPLGEGGCGSTTTTDERGVVRPFGSTGCEMGAYEIGDVALKTFTVNPTSVSSGANVTYTAIVLNGGAAKATGVTLTDTFGTHLTFVSAQTTLGSCSFVSPTLTCTLGQVPAAGTELVTMTAKVIAASGRQIKDLAKVSATTGDTSALNDTKTATVTVT
jgi:uncharacterized repeat protein (TIGR01451 family)